MQNKWQEVAPRDGVKLIHEYGLRDFPLLNCKHYHWMNCAVVAVLEYDDECEVHIAMHEDCRSQCREFVSDLKALIEKPIVALMDKQNKSVINLAKRCGFEFIEEFRSLDVNLNQREVVKYGFRK